jgi:hypothetical protein
MAIKRIKRVSGARISVRKMNVEDFDWARLKAAYGPEISADARHKIVDATYYYFVMADFELAAEPLSVAIKRIRSLQKSARRFHQSILAYQSNSNWGFNDFKTKEILGSLNGILRSLDDACEVSVEFNTLPEMLAAVPPDGTGWNTWVWRLTRIVRDFGLPEGVRNDSDKQATEGMSEFVRLIIELQSQIPKQFRRPYASPHALAKAIHRAREDCERDRKAASPATKKSRKPSSEST